MDWLYGKTGFSLLDVWALVHFCFWVFAGSCVWALDKKIRWGYMRLLCFFGCLALALIWEGLEAFLAPRFPTLWGDWFTYERCKYLGSCTPYHPGCSFESWWNSWVSDPLTCVLGVLLIWTLLDRRPK